MPSVPMPPDYITNGYGFPKQTTSCTWPYVVPIGEDPAAHGHWCTFTDLYHTIPCHEQTLSKNTMSTHPLDPINAPRYSQRKPSTVRLSSHQVGINP